MSNFMMRLIRPSGKQAKWLTLILLTLIVGLGSTGHFDIVKAYLDAEQFTYKIGEYQVSLYGLLRAILVLILIFWSTAIFTDIIESRVNSLKKVKKANKILITKLLNIGLYVLAGLVSLDIIGIDLTTLTVFNGALKIGLGFGLQKIASNFISGLILTFERSVEVDDMIELSDGIVGNIRKASARYTLIETLDGKEILVPNEDLITSRVVNWTFTNKRGRIEIPIGVSYKSDIDKAEALILECATNHPRCIKDPEPRCYLRNFGDSSVDFILHFWIDDITAGRWQPQSEVMHAIWNAFKEHNIEIPFPQRDVHIFQEQA